MMMQQPQPVMMQQLQPAMMQQPQPVMMMQQPQPVMMMQQLQPMMMQPPTMMMQHPQPVAMQPQLSSATSAQADQQLSTSILDVAPSSEQKDEKGETDGGEKEGKRVIKLS